MIFSVGLHDYIINQSWGVCLVTWVWILWKAYWTYWGALCAEKVEVHNTWLMATKLYLWHTTTEESYSYVVERMILADSIIHSGWSRGYCLFHHIGTHKPLIKATIKLSQYNSMGPSSPIERLRFHLICDNATMAKDLRAHEVDVAILTTGDAVSEQLPIQVFRIFHLS